MSKHTLFLVLFLLAPLALAKVTSMLVVPVILNVYTKPNESSSVARKLRKGESVAVLAKSAGWSLVEGSPNGYVKTQYLVETGVSNSAVKKVYFVNTDGAKVLSGPAKTYGVVEKLALNTPVTVEEIKNGWGKLEGVSSTQWIPMSFLGTTKIDAPSAKNQTPESKNSEIKQADKVPTVVQTDSNMSDDSKIKALSDTKVPPPTFLSFDIITSPNKFARSVEGKTFKPELIVMHITEAPYSNAISWLTNKKSRASCHFVVSKTGVITQLVDIKEAAWCQGTSRVMSSNSFYGKSAVPLVREKATNANLFTVGIEHEGTANNGGALTDAQIKASADLIKFIRYRVYKEYDHIIPLDRDHIVGHNEVTPISKPSCPGNKFPFAKIIEIARQ